MNLLSAPLQYGREIWQGILNELFREDQRNLKRDVAETINASLKVRGLLDLSDASAGGIKFPATQVPSSDANTLDDYEEGTFTPGISFGGGTTGLTYLTQIASYTKQGDRVQYQGYVRINDNGSSTGAARFTGLPFTTNAVGNSYSGVAVAGFGMASVSGHLQGYTNTNATTIDLYHVGSGAAAPLTEANLPNSSELIFGGNYRV